MITVQMRLKHTNMITLLESISYHEGKFDNVHEAASFVFQRSYCYPYRTAYPEFYDCEFHDDQTSTTWSTDSRGHTKRDYRKEPTEVFIRRWSRLKEETGS